MERTIEELKLIIRELIIELGELKERVSRLEFDKTGENDKAKSKPALPGTELEGEGRKNLSAIYKQGYHICPVAYGQPRDEECLFCISFLAKE